MKKSVLVFIILVSFQSLIAQEKMTNNPDEALKESIYKTNKTKVLNYSMKDFDNLFFEFNNKRYDQNILLTKEEFYTYTVKIAIFSDRLAALYPKEKAVATENKKSWLSESYEDYLLSKQTQEN